MQPIAWDDLARDASTDRRRRVKVAESWSYRSRQEHHAVASFSLIAQELADVGCEPIVLSLVTRASNDEVRHAEICARMASALKAERYVPARYRGTGLLCGHEGKSPETRALLHVVEACCLSETLSTVAFTEMLSRASHPVAHAVVQSLLTDEVDHGRVGWAYLAERANGKTLEGLSENLPDVVVRAMGAGMRPAESSDEEDDPALERYGYLCPKTIASIYRSAMHEVVLPGFEHLGVDTGSAVRAIEAQGWG